MNSIEEVEAQDQGDGDGFQDQDNIRRYSSESGLGPAGSSRAAWSHDGYSFKRWIQSIRRFRTNFSGPSNYVMGWPDDEALDESYSMFPNFQGNHTDASSATSSSILHAVKTASLSQTSLSVLNRPRTNTQTSTQRSACHSSGFSGSDVRRSVDSNRLASTLSLDEGAWNRAVQRRQIIRELLDTETTYVSGLKALTDVLSTMFVSRTGLQRSAGELLRLHNGFLAALQSTVSRSDSDSSLGLSRWTPGRKRTKNSLDIRLSKPDRKFLTTRRLREPVDSRIKSSKSVAAEPSEAADVARILMARLPKFVTYQDYGIKYQLIPQEVEELRKSINWQVYDQGIEALFRSVAPLSCREKHPNQALTFNDLLIKPIQRVCKYQLFLSDLLKYTPVSDCPSSHAAIERAHRQMIDMMQEINRTTGDPIAKDRMEKTLLLQGKVEFASKLGNERDILRDFGTLEACGVLHVAYQTSESINGEYMVCVLFNSHLLLAVPCEDRKFSAIAVIGTADIRLENADNGKGLHCQKTPYSWKIIFGVNNEAFEFIFSACSGKEAMQWKNQLLKLLLAGGGLVSRNAATVVHPALKPLPVANAHGQTFSGSGGATEKTLLRIKGTEAVPRFNQSSSASLRNPQSIDKPPPITVLAPKRQDRIRMERWISSIWTCDVIAYPGMPTGRGEYFIRSSAGSFIRRLSSRRPFTRRSSSRTTTNTGKSIEQVHQGNLATGEKDSTDITGSISHDENVNLESDKIGIIEDTVNSSPTHADTPKFIVTEERGDRNSPDKATKSSKKKKWNVPLFRSASPVKRRTWPIEAR